jgi:hypothetical protein
MGVKPRPPNARQQARQEVEQITSQCELLYKKQRRQHSTERVKHLEGERLEDDAESWIEKHAVHKNARYMRHTQFLACMLHIKTDLCCLGFGQVHSGAEARAEGMV